MHNLKIHDDYNLTSEKIIIANDLIVSNKYDMILFSFYNRDLL